MKTRFFAVLAALVVISCLTIGNNQALAQEEVLPLEAVAPAEDSPNERLGKLKESLNITLDQEVRASTVDRCVSAQLNIKKIRKNLEVISQNRVAVYQTVENRLIAVKKRLLLQEYDTSLLDLVIASYQRQIGQFKQEIEIYKQQLDDTVVVDCKTYPELFRAGLEAARESRKTLVATSLTIKEFVKSDIKNAFEVIRQKIEAK